MVLCPRLQRDIKECSRDTGIVVTPNADDLYHLTATIPGPTATPYQGGNFTIDIKLPVGYPFDPPKIKFITKIWHPNISRQSGAISLNILKNKWSPALNIKTALLSTQALLSAPEPDDPQDAVVAEQYLNDYQTFTAMARYWTETFAKTLPPVVEEKVKKLAKIGLPEDLVRRTLEVVGDDENLALFFVLARILAAAICLTLWKHFMSPEER